jgi:methyl-accepting chemotaxis protein
MTDTIIVIIAILVAITVGFIIMALIELKRTSAQVKSFLKTTEETTIKELNDAVRSIKELSDNLNDITRNARSFSASLSETAHSVKAVGKQLEGTVSKVTALRVGLRTAFGVAVKHLITKKGDKQ